MLKHSSKTTVTCKLTPSALAATLARCSAVPAPAPLAAPVSTPAASGAGRAGSHSARRASVYDPPHGSARRPGTCKPFSGKGEAVYWPRMPCLRCGCPWWLGEDWDALCVRCGWCCESEGYDNDSQPLRTGGWLERYEEFTACLKQGAAAPWPRKGGTGKASGHSTARA